MDAIKILIDEDKKDYKCYDILKSLLNSNLKFKNLVEKGIEEGKLSGFNDQLWNMIRAQNIRGINSFEDVFIDGANLGCCTSASKQLSYSFSKCYICGGVLPILAGTKNCPDGSHTWISINSKVIDTSLMLIIDESYSKNFGYIEENRYDPNRNPYYLAAKEWTNDEEIRKKHI